MLEALIELTAPEEVAGEGKPIEDKGLLTEQLLIIKNACADYDEAAAYTALDVLQERQWAAETASTLEAIRDMLFLHSDFEEAGNQADILLKESKHGAD
jgi:hypothetical protein